MPDLPIVAKINSYADFEGSEFNEVNFSGNTRITGVGTCHFSNFYENVGIATSLTANVLRPYDIVSGEFADVSPGPNKGTYARRTSDSSLIVYDEINEVVESSRVYSYVTDNLQLNLDATVSASYPGSGTTWTSLVKGTNATISGPTFSSFGGGSFLFDGIDDRITYSNSAYALNRFFSIEIWAYWDLSTPPSNIFTNGCLYTNSAVGDWAGGTANSTGLIFGFNEIRYYNIGGSEISIKWNSPTVRQWHQFVLTMSNGVGKIYVDAQQVSAATDFKYSYATFGTYGIGLSDFFSPSYRGEWIGYISSAKVYIDKVLTPQEISKNYHALRPRYYKTN